MYAFKIDSHRIPRGIPTILDKQKCCFNIEYFRSVFNEKGMKGPNKLEGTIPPWYKSSGYQNFRFNKINTMVKKKSVAI